MCSTATCATCATSGTNLTMTVTQPKTVYIIHLKPGFFDNRVSLTIVSVKIRVLYTFDTVFF